MKTVLKTGIHCAYFGARLRLVYELIHSLLRVRKGHLTGQVLYTCLARAWDNARLLALQGVVFRSVQLLLNKAGLTGSTINSSLGALAGAYLASLSQKPGRIQQQCLYYLLGRCLKAGLETGMQRQVLPLPRTKYWGGFSALVWGLLLYYFQTQRQNLHPHLVKSLSFLFIDDNHHVSHIGALDDILVV